MSNLLDNPLDVQTKATPPPKKKSILSSIGSTLKNAAIDAVSPIPATSIIRATAKLAPVKKVLENFTPTPTQKKSNFIKETVKQIPQEFAKQGQVQLQGYAALQRLAGKTLTPQGQFQEDLYGTNKPLTLTRAGKELVGADPEKESKSKFAKFAFPALGVVATGLDLIPDGEAPQKAIKAIAHETKDVGNIVKHLKDVGIGEEIASHFAPQLLQEKDINKVADTIQNAKDVHAVKVAADAEKAVVKNPLDEPVFEGHDDLSTKLLEKLKGRSTVSKQYISDLTNSPDLKQTEKEIIRTALEEEGEQVNVPEFAGKVHAELLPLERKQSSKYQPYEAPNDRNARIESGDFSERYEGVNLPDDLRGPVADYRENIYTSPVKTSAGQVHFGQQSNVDNYFGHTRVEDLPSHGRESMSPAEMLKASGAKSFEDPKFVAYSDKWLGKGTGDTRRVIEVQSDLFQKGRLEGEKPRILADYEAALTPEEMRKYRGLGSEKSDIKMKDTTPERNARIDEINKEMESYKAKLDAFEAKRNTELSKLEPYKNNAAHFRMIREEVKQAAKDGKTKLQFPTGETAMKIEGLGDTDTWRDASGYQLDTSDLKVGDIVNQGGGDFEAGDDWIVTQVLGDGKFKAIYADAPTHVGNEDFAGPEDFAKHIRDGKPLPDGMEGTDETFDISGKIDTENPIYRFYEKEVGKYLKNKYGAELHTDPQGVKWWQVDVKPQYAKLPVEAFGGAATGIQQDDTGKAHLNPFLALAGAGAAVVAGKYGLKGLKALRTAKTPLTELAQLPEKDMPGWAAILKGFSRNLPKTKRVHLFDYLGTPEFVLEKLGLQKGAEMLQDAKDVYRVNKKEAIDKILSWKKEVETNGRPHSSTRIFRYLNGDARYAKGEMTDTEIRVAKEIKEYLKDWAHRLGLPEENQIGNYITHLFDKDAKDLDLPQESAFDDPDLATIMESTPARSVYNPFMEKRVNKPGYKEDVWAALDAYVKRGTRKEAMDPALEMISDMARQLDGDSYEYVTKLTHQINMRPQTIDTLVDNFVKDKFGKKFTDRPTAYLSKKLRQVYYRGLLGLNVRSALKNLSQGANTYAKLGEKHTVIGYTKLFGKLITRNLDELYAEGVLDEGLDQDRKMGVYKTVLQKADPYLFSLFDMAEKINRGAAYYGAKSKALGKGLSPEDAVKYAKRIVRETQFAFGAVDTPILLGGDVAKTAFQLGSFSLKQIEFLQKMLKNKEYAGLTRWSLASIAFLYSIGKTFGMKPEELVPSIGLGGSPVGNIASGLKDLTLGYTQKEKDDGKDKLSQSVVGAVPAGVQIRKTIQGTEAYNAGKDVTAAGNTRFKIKHTPSNLLKSVLFGKSATSAAQSYYKGLDEKASSKKKKPKVSL